MTTETDSHITADHVREFLSEQGFEVSSAGSEDVFVVHDLESGIKITCVLQENILFNTLNCCSLPKGDVDLAMTRKLLDGENGISTSFFQLYEKGDKVLVTLNNFAKLQDLGAEDHDDILSCLAFLEVDAISARQLILGE